MITAPSPPFQSPPRFPSLPAPLSPPPPIPSLRLAASAAGAIRQTGGATTVAAATCQVGRYGARKWDSPRILKYHRGHTRICSPRRLRNTPHLTKFPPMSALNYCQTSVSPSASRRRRRRRGALSVCQVMIGIWGAPGDRCGWRLSAAEISVRYAHMMENGANAKRGPTSPPPRNPHPPSFHSTSDRIIITAAVSATVTDHFAVCPQSVLNRFGDRNL